jgi:hypothetical protein
MGPSNLLVPIARKIGHSKGFKGAILAQFLTEFLALNCGPSNQTLEMVGLLGDIQHFCFIDLQEEGR